MSTKISQLTSATDVTANDLIQIVDVEDGVMAPSGTNKKATASLLAKELAKQPLEPGVVISGSSSGGAVRITQTGSGNALVVEDSTNPDATPFVVANTGYVGIGTLFPASPLDVQGSATFRGNDGYVLFAPKYGTNPFGTDFDRFEIYVDPSNPQTFIGNSHGGTASPRDLVLSAGNSERLRITSSGNVGIGTNGPSYQFELSTDSAAKPSTSTWTISSDERLKENIEAADLDICYNAVKNIPLKRYKWKDEIYSAEQVADRSKIGWIAQDVQAVFPKAVNEHKFVYNQVKDEDGNIVSEDVIEDCLSLNSDQIYAALFGAVQKLMGEVELLQGRIAELEATP